jgi:hypothetical protein
VKVVLRCTFWGQAFKAARRWQIKHGGKYEVIRDSSHSHTWAVVSVDKFPRGKTKALERIYEGMV